MQSKALFRSPSLPLASEEKRCLCIAAEWSGVGWCRGFKAYLPQRMEEASQGRREAATGCQVVGVRSAFISLSPCISLPQLQLHNLLPLFASIARLVYFAVCIGTTFLLRPRLPHGCTFKTALQELHSFDSASCLPARHHLFGSAFCNVERTVRLVYQRNTNAAAVTNEV